ALFIIFLTFTRFYFKKDNLSILKEHLISIILFVTFTFSWVIIFSGIEPIIEFYHQLILAITLNKPLLPSIWPNVYSTVGELRSMGVKEIANSIGGMTTFVASSFSIVALLIISLVKKEYAGSKRSAVLILAIWTLAMLFASSRGIRFVMFLPFSLGISLGWVTYEIYVYFKTRKNITAVVLVLIAFFIFNGTIIGRSFNVASSIYPLIDDTWYKVLNLIKEKTPEATIVNSWWDFGDWFKAVARRPTIFDGQSQDSPRAYWMAKVLLSSNEEEAIGILRMLNNGGNEAFEIINGYLKDPLESVLLLESIISSDFEKAQEVLKNFLPSPITQKVMKALFSMPQRACFVVDYSMIPKMGAISYLGTWDFSKVYIAQNFSKQEKAQIIEHLKGLGKNDQEMQRYYQEVFLIKPKNLDDWLSRRVLFYSEVAGGKERDGSVFFDNGFIYNPKDQTIKSNEGQIPRSLFVLLDNNFTEFGLPNANSGISALVIKVDKGYKCIMLDRELATSMLVRLYFFRGLGLKHFTPLIESEEGNNNIRVFNIIW
ncbi:MAG: hypothetical protein NT066_01185, partial [Candidatus Omnitrophica bacterium]|nr:hypothetical protein [Candidatus Omnitrophota bacterium]